MAAPQTAAPRLYVYYRVAEATLPATVAAVRRVQAALVAAHPGLQAELLRRPELTAGAVTLMETYAGPLTSALEAAISEAITEAITEAISQARGGDSGALPQPRHVERFQRLA